MTARWGKVIFLWAVLAAAVSFGQSLTSGDITGTVMDQSGAVLPNAKVEVKEQGTGSVRITTANGAGIYRAAYLPPGNYMLTVSVPGFESVVRPATAQIGQSTTVDFQLSVTSASGSVTVMETPMTVQTENGNIATTFSEVHLANLPNPGADMTYIAQTAPGTVMNTQSTVGPSYGNFSVFGLPASANVYTINGENMMDPYFNINNSGASNLMLGNNEVQEASVVENAYSAQYGMLAGAQVNYVTKSGVNQFHGNAYWYWNGRTLNANNFFNNASGVPRPFDNVNQWAASGGGPIWKNRTFFYANYESVRMLFPNAPQLIQIPSPAFQAATLASLNAIGQNAAVPFYQNMFKIYNSALGAAGATSVPDSCGDLPLSLVPGGACAVQFRSAPPAFVKEYQWAVRVDHQIGANGRIYGRVMRDNGLQATTTDPLNPLFSANSSQPQMGGNLSETHTFGSTAVNQLTISALYYNAQFGPPNLAATTSVFPTTLQFGGAEFFTLGANTNGVQGRRVTQYQIIDDFSKVLASHTLRFGVNFNRNDITDLSLLANTTGTITVGSLSEFLAGGGPNTTLSIAYPSRTEAPIALYNLGVYVQDDWKVRPNLTLNFGLRVEHNSNPVCQTDCFARLSQPFSVLAHDVTIPYSHAITANQHQAYESADKVNWSPRFSFAWSPGRAQKTVIRGGVGIMYNAIPAAVASRILANNTPTANSFTISNSAGASFVPGIAGGLWSQAAQTNAAFRSAFADGATLNQLKAIYPNFSPPLFVGTEPFHTPQYQEWNLEIQRDLGWGVTGSVNYVGNHGIHELIRNWNRNAYCQAVVCGGGSFLPTAAPDPRFGEVRDYQTGAVSSYNGLVLSARKRMSGGVIFGLNYVWSHSLDEVTNGGELPVQVNRSVGSIRVPEDPYNWRAHNWGNSETDVRHYLSANYVFDDVVRKVYHGGPRAIFGGWTMAGTFFWRAGMPFSVVDTGPRNALVPYNYSSGGTILAQIIGQPPTNCGSSGIDTPCFTKGGSGEFAGSTTHITGFSAQARNQFRGPNYLNTDVQITKDIVVRERLHFGIGAQFFNVLNHPNFNLPVNNVRSPQFGRIIETVNAPTSIFGSGLGGDASPRAIQLKAQFRF